mgnify:CR=1 FL=1
MDVTYRVYLYVVQVGSGRPVRSESNYFKWLYRQRTGRTGKFRLLLYIFYYIHSYFTILVFFSHMRIIERKNLYVLYLELKSLEK